MVKKPKFLILSGDGINCERETQAAFLQAQADAKILHINDLVEQKNLLAQFDGLALPGGFSFGDELGSGQILALKISRYLGEEFQRFVDEGKPIIGICNGFQVLMKLGIFEAGERTMSLAPNLQEKFINRWVELSTEKNSVCIWTQSLQNAPTALPLSLPIRHGEGRLVVSDEVASALQNKGQVVLRYQDDVNGSYGRIAGICNASGKVFGLMPHPEAFCWSFLHPLYHRQQMHADKEQKNKTEKFPIPGMGAQFFTNAVKYLNEA